MTAYINEEATSAALGNSTSSHTHPARLPPIQLTLPFRRRMKQGSNKAVEAFQQDRSAHCRSRGENKTAHDATPTPRDKNASSCRTPYQVCVEKLANCNGKWRIMRDSEEPHGRWGINYVVLACILVGNYTWCINGEALQTHNYCEEPEDQSQTACRKVEI